MDNGTPEKKPAARPASKGEPTGPATLGNMQSLGPRDLDVTCKACGYHITINVDAYPDNMTVLSFGPRMRCSQCGHLGANVRADWSQLRGTPGNPRS